MSPIDPKTIQSIEQAAVAAVAYADLFDACLSDSEIVRLAVGRSIKPDQLLLINDQRLVHRNGYWCLTGREDLLGKVEQNQETMMAKLNHLRRWLWLFRLIPGVLMVGVTGSVAGGNPNIEDDIDVLILCRSDRMWLSRLLLSSWLSLAGQRRKPDHRPDEVKDLLCLNMWLSTKSLTEEADIYVANELARLVPLLNRQQAYERYLAANAWLEGYLPNIAGRTEIRPWRPGSWNLLVLLGDIGEWFSRWLLKKIMRQPSLERVADDRLQFHPLDHHTRILEQYDSQLKRLGF